MGDLSDGDSSTRLLQEAPTLVERGDPEAMLGRIGVALSVGLADSLNPSTVGPGLHLATGPGPAWRVTQFTLGIFGVNFAAGIVLTIGPGRLLLGLVPHPQGTVRHVLELVACFVLLASAVALWLGRRSLRVTSFLAWAGKMARRGSREHRSRSSSFRPP